MVSTCSSAQEYKQYEIGTPFIRNYPPREYKAFSQNWSIVQDRRGVMYFANGEFYESQAILLKDPSMILDLGYKYYVPRKLKGKLPLEVRNTEVDGELFAIPKGHEGTRYYSMECCASGTDTVLRTDMIGTANGEIIRGFTSGDLLMFRSQPVFLDGTKGEFTPYFTIRVR